MGQASTAALNGGFTWLNLHEFIRLLRGTAGPWTVMAPYRLDQESLEPLGPQLLD